MLITLHFMLILVARVVFAVAVSFCLLKVLGPPISAILGRIIKDDISGAFIKYVKFLPIRKYQISIGNLWMNCITNSS